MKQNEEMKQNAVKQNALGTVVFFIFCLKYRVTNQPAQV